MSIDRRRWWVLVGAVALLVGACSTETTLVDVASDDAPAAQAETAEQVEPTAVPPTPAAPTEPTAVEPAATETTVEPTPVEAEPTPEPEPTSEVTVDDLDEIGARIFARSTFAADLQGAELECAINRLAESSGLMARILDGTGDFEDLPVEDQTTLAIIAFDCAPEAVANEFSSSFDSGAVTFPETVGDCLVVQMGEGAPNRDAVIEGFIYLGDDRPVPIASQEPVVETMLECFPGSIFASAMAEAALDDPDLANAVDFACLETGIDNDAIRPLWEALVSMPGAEFDSLDAATTGPLLDAIFACISFGQVIASQAPAGVTISEGTIECIDSSLTGVNIIEAMESESGGAELGAVLLSCLTPEELQAMGGG